MEDVFCRLAACWGRGSGDEAGLGRQRGVKVEGRGCGVVRGWPNMADTQTWSCEPLLCVCVCWMKGSGEEQERQSESEKLIQKITTTTTTNNSKQQQQNSVTSTESKELTSFRGTVFEFTNTTHTTTVISTWYQSCSTVVTFFSSWAVVIKSYTTWLTVTLLIMFCTI